MDRQRAHTHKRTRLQAICDWESKKWGNTGFHADVFRFEGLSHTEGWRVLNNETPPSTKKKSPDDGLPPEKRGRKLLISPAMLHDVEELVKEHAEARTWGWEKLSEEAFGAGISGGTLRDVMGVTDYWKCIACSRAWCSPQLAAKRVDFARAHLERRPHERDWETVAFSDEVHAGWGPAGKPRVTRRSGERLCKDCVGLEGVPTGTDKKRVHGWGVFHFKWKSELLLYDVEEAGNLNGKMSAKCYVDRILEPVVRPWVEEVKLGRLAPFNLVEDPNGANGVGVNSEARRWKRQNSRGHIDYHFNERASPDLAPAEECWQPYKYDVKEYSGWNEEYAKGLVLDGWERVKQEQIAMAIHSMPRRLRRRVEMDGQYSGY
jgi:hypothetical protein